MLALQPLTTANGGREVVAPTNPVTVEALPDEIAALVEGISLERVAFADGQALDIRAHMNCREGE